MKKKLSLLILMMLSVSNVFAEEWTSIIKDDDHEVLVDIDSYNVADNLPYLTAKTIYQQPQTFNTPQKKTSYSISIAKFQFNCKEPLYRLRTIELMNDKNSHINTIKINSRFQQLKPDTDEFSIGQLTCQVHQMLGGS